MDHQTGETCTLTLDGKEYTLPVLMGTTGKRSIDISTLREATGGVTTFDPSYANTASCSSEISWIDGENGELTYRGIPIETLAKEKISFLETAWLLIFGKLPTADESKRFGELLAEYSALHRSMALHFNAFPPNGPPDGDHVLDDQRDEHPRQAPGDRRGVLHGVRGQAAVQGEDHRGGLVQGLHRRAEHLPAVRPEICRELPAHDVLAALQEVRDRPGGRRGAEPVLRAARRSRAELLDLHREDGGLLRSEPVHLLRGRGVRPCGVRVTAVPM
jgi:hypothetical protein